MSDQEIRLACLRLAAEIVTPKGGNATDVIALADRLYGFIYHANAGSEPS